MAREEELALLSACMAAPPSLAVVEGEAGVGKTRLVAELLAGPTVTGRQVLFGRCHPLRDPFPLGPVVEALRGVADGGCPLRLSGLAGALRPILPELADRLPPLPPPLADWRMERHRQWRAVVELLGAVGPAVVVIEDLHWAHDATVEFLTFLAACQPADTVLLLTWRPADLAPGSPLPSLAARAPVGGGQHVRLMPLAPNDLKTLVNCILGSDDVSNEFVAYLHERTAGLPFAVEEVLGLLQDRQDLVRWEGQWARRALAQLEVPAAVRGAVLERMRWLDPPTRQVVEAAAVVGHPVGETVLARVAGLPRPGATSALLGALQAAVLEELGGSGGVYGFRHSLAAEAIYSAIPGPERSRLHRRAADYLGRQGDRVPAAELARHCKFAGLGRRWVRYAQVAAAQAAALGDHAAAAALLLDAVSAPGIPAATRGQLAVDLSVAALEGLTHAEAIAAVAGIFELGGLPRAMRGPLLFNLGSLLHQAGDASTSHRHIAGAVPHLADQHGLRALAMSALASPWVVEGRLEEHLGWMEEAGRGAAEYGNEVVIRAVRANQAAVLSAVGDPAAARSEPEPPPAGARDEDRIDWLRSCTNLAVSACYVGSYEASRRWTILGMRESESLGYDRFTSPLRAVDLLLRWLTGDWRALAADAASLEDGAMDVPSAVQASVVRGLVDLASGQIGDVDPRLVDAMHRSARCGAIPTMGMAAAGVARLHLARGDAGAARTVALRALGTAAAKGIWIWALDVAPAAVEALVACGAEEEARDWTEQLERGLAGRTAPTASASVATCHALLAGDEGPARFAYAQEAWAALPRPYEAALAGERRGRLLISRDRDAGGAALLEALDAFRGLGAEWDDGRVRRELRRHHVALPYPSRRRRRDYDDVLSGREREVVELVASGLSSTRIAQRLHLSARTVDHHVERALRKLGMPSRRELVAARQAASDGPAPPGRPQWSQ